MKLLDWNSPPEEIRSLYGGVNHGKTMLSLKLIEDWKRKKSEWNCSYDFI